MGYNIEKGEVYFMDECPKCKRWTLYYDPQRETRICSNCDYKKSVKYEDFIKEKNVINDLFYPSKMKQFFFFSSSSGQYTGESILFVEELAEKIKKIEIRTIEFHFHNRDFEKWIVDVFRNEELASAISSLHEKDLKGETLRNELYNVIIFHLRK